MQHFAHKTDDTKPLKNWISRIIFISLAMAAGHSTAYAYLDLGTGSLLLQGILAGLAAAWLTCSMYWQRIKNLFRRKSVEPEPATPAEEAEQRDTP